MSCHKALVPRLWYNIKLPFVLWFLWKLLSVFLTWILQDKVNCNMIRESYKSPVNIRGDLLCLTYGLFHTEEVVLLHFIRKLLHTGYKGVL